MMKALFLSASIEQSSYWADQLGFGRNKWKHISRPEDIYGYRNVLVYLVGTESPFVQKALDICWTRGIECILAEEMVPDGRIYG
jgi:hypothetical protein